MIPLDLLVLLALLKDNVPAILDILEELVVSNVCLFCFVLMAWMDEFRLF